MFPFILCLSSWLPSLALFRHSSSCNQASEQLLKEVFNFWPADSCTLQSSSAQIMPTASWSPFQQLIPLTMFSGKVTAQPPDHTPLVLSCLSQNTYLRTPSFGILVKTFPNRPLASIASVPATVLITTEAGSSVQNLHRMTHTYLKAWKCNSLLAN